MQDLSQAVLRLRKDQLWRHARLAGVTNDREMAEHLRLSSTTIWRLFRDDIGPGERVIAATLVAFPGLGFDDLFEVVADVRELSAA